MEGEGKVLNAYLCKRNFIAMSKALATWFTVAILLLSLGAPTLVTIVFELDRERIAKEECREREVENSCCKGACVLNERLQTMEGEPDPTAPQSERVLPEVQLVFIQPTATAYLCDMQVQSTEHLRQNSGSPNRGFAQLRPNPPQTFMA